MSPVVADARAFTGSSCRYSAIRRLGVGHSARRYTRQGIVGVLWATVTPIPPMFLQLCMALRCAWQRRELGIGACTRRTGSACARARKSGVLPIPRKLRDSADARRSHLRTETTATAKSADAA